MVGLNKVFPTLDCSQLHLHAAHGRVGPPPAHPPADLHGGRAGRAGGQRGSASSCTCKPRYLARGGPASGATSASWPARSRCPHEFDYGLGARRAIYIPHGNAIPQKAVLDVRALHLLRQVREGLPDQLHRLHRRRPARSHVEVGAVIVATGLEITPMVAKTEYGGGKLLNVMSPLAMERVQSSNGPYGRVLRPSDGKIPRSIAYVQCAGSRDRSIGVPYCSRVCCMYALKQALLLHALHPRRRGHPLLHGHPRLRQGLRAVLPPRGRRGREGRQGQGGPDHRGGATTTSQLRVELLDEDGRVDGSAPRPGGAEPGARPRLARRGRHRHRGGLRRLRPHPGGQAQPVVHHR